MSKLKSKLNRKISAERIIIIILFVVCISLIFSLNAKNEYIEINKNYIVNQIKSNKSEVFNSFSNYSRTGENHHYIQGVAEFSSYLYHYKLLNDGKTDDLYNIADLLYTEMVLREDLVKENIEELIIAISRLSYNYNQDSVTYLENFQKTLLKARVEK